MLSNPVGAFVRRRILTTCFVVLFIAGCGYRYYAGPLKPAPEMEKKADIKVADDGTVTWVRERLEIGLRPMTDEELNRAFATYSGVGIESTNPYTFSDWKDPVTREPPGRFTVFLLKVKNYTYPKVKVEPLKASILADNGRAYSSLSLAELKEYYHPYVRAYAGNLYAQFEERKDVLVRTLYAGDMIFSGQEVEGYIVFPVLHPDVREITVSLKGVALRYDFRGEPVEMVDLGYRFRRDTGRINIPTGKVRLEQQGEEGAR
jgi:hypothetical protein